MAEFPSDYSTTAPPSAPISPAWEDESRPIFDRWKDTVVGVFTAPTAFFDAMRTEGGIGAPLVFAIIGGWIGAAVNQVWGLFSSFTVWTVLQRMGLPIPLAQMGGQGLVRTACAIVFAPVILAVVLFISAGILHLCLMLVGGARRPFETTFRVVAYAGGSIGLLNVVPVCGVVAVSIWVTVAQVIGVSRAHQISTGKALIAVLIPLAVVLTCCVLGLLLGVLGGVAAMNMGR